MQSTAAVLKEFNRPLSIEKVEVPPLEEGEVLIRMEAAGVCGSDVHMWSGKDPRTPLPIILGHEGVGSVEDFKGQPRYADGRPVAPGDRVIWNRGVTCGTCYFCRHGEASLCPSRWAYGIHRSMNERPYVVGCYSEYLILDAGTDMFKVTDPIDPAVLVNASCSGATTAHAFAVRTPRPEDTVLIQGPGPIGVFAVAFAVQAGVENIIVIGGTPERLEICRDMGAAHIINRQDIPQADRRDLIMDLTDGRGVDIAYECVGHHAVLEEGLRLLRRGGAYLTMGFGAPGGTLTLDCYAQLTVRNISIQGIWVSDAHHLQMAADLVIARQDDFARLVTHRIPLRKADRGIEVMKNREGIKAVLTFA